MQRPLTKKEETKRLAGDVPVADHRALTISAEQNGRTLASELRIAVAFYLKAQGQRA